jgi:hypothetical protein
MDELNDASHHLVKKATSDDAGGIWPPPPQAALASCLGPLGGSFPGADIDLNSSVGAFVFRSSTSLCQLFDMEVRIGQNAGTTLNSIAIPRGRRNEQYYGVGIQFGEPHIFTKSFTHDQRHTTFNEVCQSNHETSRSLSADFVRPCRFARQFHHVFHYRCWIPAFSIREYPDFNRTSAYSTSARGTSSAGILSYANFSILT